MKPAFIFLLVLIFMAVEGCRDTSFPRQSNDSRPEGQRLFERYCKGCHGRSGDLSFGGAVKLSESVLNESEIAAVIKDGRGNMLGFERLLNPDEIGLIAEYVNSLQKIN